IRVAMLEVTPASEIANRDDDGALTDGQLDLHLAGTAAGVRMLDRVRRGFAERQQHSMLVFAVDPETVEPGAHCRAHLLELRGLSREGMAESLLRDGQQSHPDEDDVVRLARVDQELLEQAVADPVDRLVMVCTCGPLEPGETRAEVLATALYQTVGKEQQERAWLDHRGRLGELAPGGAVERGGPSLVEPDRLAGRLDEEHRRMSGGRVLEQTVVGVQDGVARGCETRVAWTGGEAVEAREQLPGARRLRHEGGARATEAAHGCGRLDPPADDVPD